MPLPRRMWAGGEIEFIDQLVLNLDDIVERADRFNNEKIIFTHVSTRYLDHQIEKGILKRLPESLRERVELWF